MRLFRKRVTAKPAVDALRHGLLEADLVGTGWKNNGKSAGHVQYEVVETACANGLSRVKVLRVSGIPSWQHRDVADLLPEWVPTAKVSWFAERSAEGASTAAKDESGVADADSVPGYKDRVLALAAEIAVLVCVRDVAHVDDRPGRKRLDQAANEIGYLLGLPQPEFAELWTARSDRSVIGRASKTETKSSGGGGHG